VSKHLLNEDKASGECHGFLEGINCAGTIQNPDALFICSESKAAATITQNRN